MRIAISIGAVAAALLLALAAGREGPALAQPADVHDAVVLAVKSLRVTIPAGKPGAVKRARVKVLNADRDGTQTIRLATCPLIPAN